MPTDDADPWSHDDELDDLFADMDDAPTDPLDELLADTDDPWPHDDLLDDVTGDDELDELLTDTDDAVDDLLDDVDPWSHDDLLDDVEREPYTVVERTQRCGKDACSCSDDPDEEHGPYEFRIHAEPDGSHHWEYIGPAYDI